MEVRGTRRPMRAPLCALAATLLLGVSAAHASAQDTASVRPVVGTPRFVVTGYRPASPPNRAAADTVARVLQSRIRIDTLWVIDRRDLEAMLPPWPYWDREERWSMRDLRAVGRQMRADFVLDVAVSSDPAGVRLVAELIWTREVALPPETLTRRSMLPIASLDVAGPTVAAAAESLVDRLLLDAAALDLRRGPPR